MKQKNFLNLLIVSCFLILLSSFLVPGRASAFLPSCNNADDREITLKDLSKDLSFKKKYLITEVVNNDPGRDNRSRQLTGTFICLEEGYTFRSNGADDEKIISHKELKQLERIVQEFTDRLKKIPNVEAKYYTINPITSGNRIIGWVIRHCEGVEKISYWVFKKEIVFAIQFKSVGTDTDTES